MTKILMAYERKHLKTKGNREDFRKANFLLSKETKNDILTIKIKVYVLLLGFGHCHKDCFR